MSDNLLDAATKTTRERMWDSLQKDLAELHLYPQAEVSEGLASVPHPADWVLRATHKALGELRGPYSSPEVLMETTGVGRTILLFNEGRSI